MSAYAKARQIMWSSASSGLGPASKPDQADSTKALTKAPGRTKQAARVATINPNTLTQLQFPPLALAQQPSSPDYAALHSILSVQERQVPVLFLPHLLKKKKSSPSFI